MASSLIHLRMAEKLLTRITDLCPAELMMGAIAPAEATVTEKDIDRFRKNHFSRRLCKGYTQEEYSFFLGIYAHLLTELYWQENMPQLPEDAQLAADSRFLLAHPEFQPLQILNNIADFSSPFTEEYPADVLESRRRQVCEACSALTEAPLPDADLPFELETDKAIRTCVEYILSRIFSKKPHSCAIPAFWILDIFLSSGILYHLVRLVPSSPFDAIPLLDIALAIVFSIPVILNALLRCFYVTYCLYIISAVNYALILYDKHRRKKASGKDYLIFAFLVIWGAAGLIASEYMFWMMMGV